MPKVEIEAPVTLHYGGQYVPPGTPVTLDKEEAESLTARFGVYNGPAIDNAKVSAADAASIATLNIHNAVNKGFGEGSDRAKMPSAGVPATSTDAPPVDTDLHAMTKAELLEEAETLRVPDVKSGDSKAEILEKIEAFNKAKG